MRQYRGKRIDNGEWVKGDLIIVHGIAFIFVMGVCYDCKGCTNPRGVATCTDGSCFVQVDLDTVGQGTGLKDKNGVDIYCGDILDFEEGEWGGKFKPEVVTEESIRGTWDLCGSLSDLTEWRKVIGDIHEDKK